MIKPSTRKSIPLIFFHRTYLTSLPFILFRLPIYSRHTKLKLCQATRVYGVVFIFWIVNAWLKRFHRNYLFTDKEHNIVHSRKCCQKNGHDVVYLDPVEFNIKNMVFSYFITPQDHSASFVISCRTVIRLTSLSRAPVGGQIQSKMSQDFFVVEIPVP